MCPRSSERRCDGCLPPPPPTEASQLPSPDVSKAPSPTISLEKLNQELTSPVAPGARPQGAAAATYAFNGDTTANNGYIAATTLQVPVRSLGALIRSAAWGSAGSLR